MGSHSRTHFLKYLPLGVMKIPIRQENFNSMRQVKFNIASLFYPSAIEFTVLLRFF